MANSLGAIALSLSATPLQSQQQQSQQQQDNATTAWPSVHAGMMIAGREPGLAYKVNQAKKAGMGTSNEGWSRGGNL
jgi:membrane protease subunit (stomatin/prohibitin family)